MTTRLEIGGSNYPLAVNIPMYINFVLADVREPDKRNSSFSKTIQLYGTNEVNKLFENCFDVNCSLATFNPNKKIEARYFANSVLVFEGSLQILSITLKPGNLIVYDCCIIGLENGIFLTLGDKMLSELDFSAYDHVYSRANIIASDASMVTSTGYYYPTNIDNGTSVGEGEYKVENFIPCFYAYEYIKKIIEDNGYTYSSSFLTGSFFKRLIIYPNFNAIKLNTTQIDNQQFHVGLNADIPIVVASLTTFNFNNETGGFFDIGNQVSGTTAILNENGYYNIAAKIKMKLSFTHTDATVTYAVFTNPLTNIQINRSTDGGGTYPSLVNSNQFIGGSAVLNINKATDYFYENAVASDVQFQNAGYRFQVVHLYSLTNVKYYNASNVEITTGTGTIVFNALSGFGNTSMYAIVDGNVAADGNTLDANKLIPINIKQKDFFKSILQMFNLFVDFDRTNKTNLIIEPYSDFFTTDVVDWNNRTDLNKDIKINPIGLLDAKRYIYKYKDDKDYYNTKYKDKWNETYGSEIIDVDNDFLKTDKVSELIFSPSPTVANRTLQRNDIKIYKNQDTRAAEVPNIRILVANGVKTCINDWTFKSVGLSDVVTNSYNDALMEDDDLFPIGTLQFGYPKELFYDYVQAAFAQYTLYNAYHQPQIDNITNKNSKVDIRYLWINQNEINQFSFRKRYFIDNSYFIINKIVNYNPINEGSVQVELIKLLTL